MNTVLEMKGIRKVFPGVVALDDVNLKLERGKVLALLGENGAGKSTLMKILSGSYQPDDGEIFLYGEKVEIKDVMRAKELGISIIYQELSLCQNLTVAENIFALQEPTRWGLIKDDEIISRTRELFEEFNVDIDPTKMVEELSVSSQQMVEIVKALSLKPKIVIMDEPTSALSKKETETLFEIIEKLQQEGVSIIYISHRMEEIFRITNDVSVLRDGKYIGTVKTADTSSEELIKMMVGRTMDNIYPVKDFKYLRDEKLLEVRGYNKENYFHDINLYVRPGEILGLYGLMGSGRTEIAQGIFGILKKDRGEMFIHDKKVEIKDPFSAIQHKIAFVTEDRKREGLILTASVAENATMANIDKILNKFKLIEDKREAKIAKEHVADLKVKTPSIHQTINKLSGGNQQKVVISKWFEIEPEILILDEPTRGIDVSAKYEIYKLMIELAQKGVGIIMISSELPEILNVSDRLLVINKRQIVTELDPKNTTQEEIMTYIAGRGE
ncbi:sugar ABC transporter ATP-binding protein [Natronincola ferrireducens]|uniref:Monosaccharide ABC transporter ATP-binding protein, CUT2 family (TC 3.A.1.2.-) n=1 Tax=Natronincola ferrireducens TaxID=393762 RepID=A0A1G8X7X3_9FIRM|nr:sugar ABC transporter ATP-binding protein [Natronincola ferrireducens]SDJ86758.1 monosaccharide ABC transporter ATP-binding protein, CUT2 family (TC 3.A.1.2.-) [Natronincola ferrireducens]